MEWLINKETTPGLLNCQIRNALYPLQLQLQIYLTEDNKTLVVIINELTAEQIELVEQTILDHQAWVEVEG